MLYCTKMVTRIYRNRRPQVFLKEWMDHRGLSDETLANRLSVARATVTRWRNQTHRLDTAKVALVADALDIEPGDLWRHPDRPSLDAMVDGAPEELRQTATDIVRRLVGLR